MKKDTMSPRERWLAVISHRIPDRVPMDYWGTGEATEKLLTHLNCTFDEMLVKLHIDIPHTVMGRYIGPPPEEGCNIWGIKYRQIEYATGVYSEPISSPLADFNSVEEIEAGYVWPDPDHWDYSHLPEDVKGKEHRPIRGGGSEPFLLYKLLRGEIQAFVDLVENPEIVDYCLDKLFSLAYQDTLRIFETIPGKVIITYVAEDLGGQTTLMYSPKHIRRYLLPRMKKMMELTKQHGSFVFHHTDGAAREIIPDLVETGIEVLNPIQWRCPGMEREGLKRDFGSRIAFHGGVDNQYTIPFGTVDEVRQEVQDNIRILGDGGGYILAPCHNIQSVGPAENVVALYEAGYEYGWY
ncbi:uroporphyrinogen decarboxylase family protein [uncultured Desulfobulbus sp.]|uniref:uroporphyrinogen decarboxylase family protein n=1 Tax=uncultured Desulfobulbus sp. TaxID=239745 RepID=UPI0029C8C81B|nr:uroporphyrinogen decarboxylase family protein [uncultured Desulfobulbus sp.]